MIEPTTFNKYRTRANNFYREHCVERDPPSAQICAALLARAPHLQPNSFATLKNALRHDQLARGNKEAAKAIRKLVNPVTAPGSLLKRKTKPPKVRSVKVKDFDALVKHLRSNRRIHEAASVILAYYLGTRPCEMRDIVVLGNQVLITGGKKNEKLQRGADRTLEILESSVSGLVATAAEIMSKCLRSDAAIRDRLRQECRLLWPRRKDRPTLKSFRHQLGATLKASDETAEGLAYFMGHQSTDSISIYGNRRSGQGRTLHVVPAEGADLSKVRKPAKTPIYGRERVIGVIEFHAATRARYREADKPDRDSR